MRVARKIFTIGHGRRTLEQLVARGHGVTHAIGLGAHEPHGLTERRRFALGERYLCGALVA